MPYVLNTANNFYTKIYIYLIITGNLRQAVESSPSRRIYVPFPRGAKLPPFRTYQKFIQHIKYKFVLIHHKYGKLGKYMADNVNTSDMKQELVNSCHVGMTIMRKYENYYLDVIHRRGVRIPICHRETKAMGGIYPRFASIDLSSG